MINKALHILRKYGYLIILVAILIHAFFNYYMLALELENTEINRHGKGYVSDEVWYVSSARNILIKVFGVTPSIPDKNGATIIFSKKPVLGVLKKVASEYNVSITDPRYSEIHAVYVESTDRDSIIQYVSALHEEYGYNATDIVFGWRLPDAANIQNYLNLEHPPMVKYLIALSIAVLGDRPLFWRIPNIIAGVIMLILLFYLVESITRNKWLGVVVVLLASLDPIMRALSSIALLDIYVALFTVASLIPAVHKRYHLAILLGIIGSTFKFSVLFVLIPIYLLYIREALKKNPRFIEAVSKTIYFGFLVVFLFIIMQAVVAIPLITYLGITSWLYQSIFGAIMWHTSIKCGGGGCPTTSFPLDWFVGANPFPLYFFPDNRGLYAIGYWPFWTLSFVSIIVFLPAYYVEKRYGLPTLFLLGTWSGYILLWIIGGRTQYSFYSVQLVGLVYMELVCAIVYVVLNRDIGRRMLVMWRNIVYYVWDIVLKILAIR